MRMVQLFSFFLGSYISQLYQRKGRIKKKSPNPENIRFLKICPKQLEILFYILVIGMSSIFKIHARIQD